MPDGDKNIALFGGSFDPPHLGHLDIAREAVRKCALDRVVFIPCHLSPHKRDHPPVSAHHRVKMLELCTAGEPWAEISQLEISQLNHPIGFLLLEFFHHEGAEERRRTQMT